MQLFVPWGSDVIKLNNPINSYNPDSIAAQDGGSFGCKSRSPHLSHRFGNLLSCNVLKKK